MECFQRCQFDDCDSGAALPLFLIILARKMTVTVSNLIAYSCMRRQTKRQMLDETTSTWRQKLMDDYETLS